MAIVPVSLGPGLRVWADVGLTHVLLDVPVASVGIDGEARATPLPHPPPVVSGTSTELRSDSPRPAQDSQSPYTLPKKAPTTIPEVGGASTFPAHSTSPDNWPEVWRNWFAKLAPAPVLWTYHELGADISKTGHSQERSAFFRSLIGELSLPKGSSVFWPVAMPCQDLQLQANAAVFTSGVRLLRPKVIVFFGERALEDAALSVTISSFGQTMVEGKLLVLLPEIEAMLHGKAQRSSAVSLLRALFSVHLPSRS